MACIPTETDIGRWAVWRYDGFPGYLTGKIGPNPGWCRDDIPVIKDGACHIVQYGGYFKPLCIVSETTGLKLKAEIASLGSLRRRAFEEAESLTKLVANGRLSDLLPNDA